MVSSPCHLINLCSSLTYHLRNITRICWFLDTDSCHHVIHLIILSHLDYANAILLGSNETDILRLQRLQNRSAKLIFQARKYDHAIPFCQPYEVNFNNVTFDLYTFMVLLSPSVLSGGIHANQYICMLRTTYRPRHMYYMTSTMTMTIFRPSQVN